MGTRIYTVGGNVSWQNIFGEKIGNLFEKYFKKHPCFLSTPHSQGSSLLRFTGQSSVYEATIHYCSIGLN